MFLSQCWGALPEGAFWVSGRVSHSARGWGPQVKRKTEKVGEARCGCTQEMSVYARCTPVFRQRLFACSSWQLSSYPLMCV